MLYFCKIYTIVHSLVLCTFLIINNVIHRRECTIVLLQFCIPIAQPLNLIFHHKFLIMIENILYIISMSTHVTIIYGFKHNTIIKKSLQFFLFDVKLAHKQHVIAEIIEF